VSQAYKWAMTDTLRAEDLCGDALKKVWPSANFAAVLHYSNSFMC